MKLSRKLILGAGALVLPLTGVVMMGAGSASAARSSVVGTGVLTCTSIKGSITFTPPLTTSGTAPETSTIVKVTVKKCTGSTNGNPSKGTVNTNIATPTSTDGCGTLASGSSTPETLAVTWAGGFSGSSSTYAGFNPATDAPPGPAEAGFTLPQSGTGSTSGSWAEGSGSTSTTYSNKTASQILAECNGAGLKTLKLTEGTTTL